MLKYKHSKKGFGLSRLNKNFRYYFNISKKSYKNKTEKEIINDIRKKYSCETLDELYYEKNKLKYWIHRYSQLDTSMYIILAISIAFSAFGMFSERLDYTTEIISNVYKFTMISITIAAILKAFIEAKYKLLDSFYKLCLDILEDVEQQKIKELSVNKELKLAELEAAADKEVGLINMIFKKLIRKII